MSEALILLTNNKYYENSVLKRKMFKIKVTKNKKVTQALK